MLEYNSDDTFRHRAFHVHTAILYNTASETIFIITKWWLSLHYDHIDEVTTLSLHDSSLFDDDDVWHTDDDIQLLS